MDYISLEHIIRDMNGPVSEASGTEERRKVAGVGRPTDGTDGTEERRKVELVGRPKDEPTEVPAVPTSALYRHSQIQSKIIDEAESPDDDVQKAIAKIKGGKGNPVDLEPTTDDRNNDNQRQDADSKKARALANRQVGQMGDSNFKEEVVAEDMGIKKEMDPVTAKNKKLNNVRGFARIIAKFTGTGPKNEETVAEDFTSNGYRNPSWERPKSFTRVSASLARTETNATRTTLKRGEISAKRNRKHVAQKLGGIVKNAVTTSRANKKAAVTASNKAARAAKATARAATKTAIKKGKGSGVP